MQQVEETTKTTPLWKKLYHLAISIRDPDFNPIGEDVDRRLGFQESLKFVKSASEFIERIDDFDVLDTSKPVLKCTPDVTVGDVLRMQADKWIRDIVTNC